MKKVLFAFLFLFAFAGSLFAQSLDSLVAVVSDPPKFTGQSIAEIFGSWTTYISAIVILISVYVAQWFPVIRTGLSYVRPYFRAIIVGGAIIAVIIQYWGASAGQVSWSFLLSNLFFEIIKALFPQIKETYSEQERQARGDIADVLSR